MCILVVEDDPLIRAILVEELEDAAFPVQQAATGDEAILMVDALEPELAVLVTDIHMPGNLNGIQLAGLIRERLPDVPIIYTTGRPESLNEVRKLDRRQFLIAKPYVPAEIIERIRDMLRP